MKDLLSHLPGRLLASDLLSSGLSVAALLWRGRVDAGSATAPVNAISHWLWPRAALRQDQPSARFTLTGLGVHFLAALLWSGAYEALQSRRARRQAPTALAAVGDALAVSAVAAVVDLRCVPERLTPGFERRVSGRSLGIIYLAFAAGLALSGLAARSCRSRP